MVLEVPGGSQRAVRDIPMLSDFPLIEAAAHSADCNYPSLQWQPRAVKIAVLRMIAGAVWVKVRLSDLVQRFCNNAEVCQYHQRRDCTITEGYSQRKNAVLTKEFQYEVFSFNQL